jgi:FkbM family methyltransferase
MATAVETLNSTPAGRIAFKVARPVVRLLRRVLTPIGRLSTQATQPAVHLARHLANPKIPVDQTISRVSYRGKRFAILHRRTRFDALAVRQCFADAQYDLPDGAHGILVARIYNEILESGRQPLIIDCGANIGASVLWFLARYPHAHIIAVEPAPDNAALLRRNCAGLDVDVRQAGIAGEDGIAHLSNPGTSGMGYQTHQSNAGPEIDMVAVATLLESTPASLYTPFLLKVDVEGAEMDLFSGDCSAINRFPLIILEPHDWLLPGRLSSQSFFRFHAAAGREFCMKHENIASIALRSDLLGITTGLKN